MKKLLSFVLSLCFVSKNFNYIEKIYANEIFQGYHGDISCDGKISADDAVLMLSYLTGRYTIDENERLIADMNGDSTVNIADLLLLKSCIIGKSSAPEIYQQKKFISSSVKSLGASMPTHNNAEAVIFYVDFPDCKYPTNTSEQEIEAVAFGPQDESSENYPFESMSAFYERSSKSALKLSGKVFSYTARKSIEYYNQNQSELVTECFEAFNSSTNFSKFDGNNDGIIDVCILNVPPSADNNYWWPVAGQRETTYYTVDRMNIGYVITGNSDIRKKSDFVSTYLHEMSHCLGLPDYYLYSNDEGMNGPAGSELMDIDCHSDFCAVSKLMLGWYTENQVIRYDKTFGEKTYILSDAQTDSGNCIVIPRNPESDYNSEYFVIEYQSFSANNSAVTDLWWQNFDPGIRIYHMSAETNFNGYWTHFKYESGVANDDGRRFIRLVNDGEMAFKSGDTINSTVSGFCWYDENEKETVSPKISIQIGKFSNGKYSITLTPE